MERVPVPSTRKRPSLRTRVTTTKSTGTVRATCACALPPALPASSRNVYAVSAPVLRPFTSAAERVFAGSSTSVCTTVVPARTVRVKEAAVGKGAHMTVAWWRAVEAADRPVIGPGAGSGGGAGGEGGEGGKGVKGGEGGGGDGGEASISVAMTAPAAVLSTPAACARTATCGQHAHAAFDSRPQAVHSRDACGPPCMHACKQARPYTTRHP